MNDGKTFFDHIQQEVEKVIHGKKNSLHLILSCFLTGGHVLLEDLPGTGKTILAKTLAKILGLDFARVQFTPDLLPSDIIGTTMYDDQVKKFFFRKGALFTTFFLGDEINRATPRTQSALLEAMAEGQITVEKISTKLDELFFVIATQNPVEQYGTFPLPEAQLDRFAMKLSLGHPDQRSEILMLKSRMQEDPFLQVKTLFSAQQLLSLKAQIKNVKIADNLYFYITEIMEKTRKHPSLKMGASPRGSLFLKNCAQAFSFLSGKTFVDADCIFTLAPYILSHRIMLDAQAVFNGQKPLDIIKEILKQVKAPLK